MQRAGRGAGEEKLLSFHRPASFFFVFSSETDLWHLGQLQPIVRTRVQRSEEDLWSGVLRLPLPPQRWAHQACPYPRTLDSAGERYKVGWPPCFFST
ncbi:hypothetical protein NDU88_001309 [Pleurodeles waltl]|uniref:Uncharacterized protein n=1 Tax=Pleurodeles waltl TaxID=8319 RepID=A0AAV7W134_PLEWA|nr:hypothetical protein NDU88_001309 [Pleurodeles waltl]